MSESLKARAKRLRDMFLLTIEKWGILQAYQNDTCAICGAPARPERRLATDHDWVTGEVRGLLCNRCNTILGKIERGNRGGKPWTVDELKKAVSYKEDPPARRAWGVPHFGWPGDVTTKKHRKMLKRLSKEKEKADHKATETPLGASRT